MHKKPPRIPNKKKNILTDVFESLTANMSVYIYFISSSFGLRAKCCSF